MKIDEVKQNGEDFKKLADKGAEIILEIKDFIAQSLPGHFKTVQSTAHMLCVSYYGYRLIFRIEILLTDAHIQSEIKAYSLSYGTEPVEKFLDVANEFDNLGNIFRQGKQALTPKEFPPHFIAAVFTQALAEGSILLKP